jgi:serine/threonine-protein kinase
VEAQEGKTVETEIPATPLSPGPVRLASSPALQATPVAMPGGATADPDAARSGAKARATIGIVVAGAGLVALGVGSYFGVQALSQFSDSNANGCTGDICRQPGYAVRNDARASADLSTILLGAGGAALVGGALLWFTARNAASHDATSLAVHVALGPTGVRVGAAFP